MALSKRGRQQSAQTLTRKFAGIKHAAKLVDGWDKNDINVSLLFDDEYAKRNTARGNAGTRYELYSKATSFAEFINICEDNADEFVQRSGNKIIKGYSGKGYADLVYDLTNGLATFGEPVDDDNNEAGDNDDSES